MSHGLFLPIIRACSTKYMVRKETERGRERKKERQTMNIEQDNVQTFFGKRFSKLCGRFSVKYIII